jgi:hypothetical protein
MAGLETYRSIGSLVKKIKALKLRKETKREQRLEKRKRAGKRKRRIRE